MRYSMLVYLTNMGKTLLEAARYLRTAPEGPLQKELLENGRQMIGQISLELERHRGDLRTPLPQERLRDIARLWDVSDTGSELEKTLEEFIRRLPGEVRYQVRAVFFAELGEKWDSMESVYTFMRDDPRFDPVVVLAPVFRVVNKQGRQEQEVIYKDYLTPLGIPFLDYDQYSLEKDCPELAFTSQPYEGCTPKEFWPEYIAKHTRLVYLNYGMLGAVFEDTAQSLCQLPVFRYAWKVIGASERYNQYYRKHAVNGGGNMLVTGLPKFDPVIRLKKEGTAIPEEWRAAVKDKKVILWNTWYDPMRCSLAYFDRVADWFRGHSDCVLIWRMHPMTKTVTKLYYPKEYYEQLRRHIAEAEAAPNIILDQNVSYSAAFACSDGMISDYSSMMFQYLLTDKPVLWIKRRDGSGPFNGKMLTGEFLIDWRWMEEAEEFEGITQFIERIQNGEDRKADIRSMVLQRDLPLADGHCGERVCNALWNAMHGEDFELEGEP